MAGKEEGAKDATPPSDPLVGARTNLRETVKWLITSLAALAAGIIAGSPFSGMGALTGGRLIVAIVALVLAMIFIVVAIVIAFDLLFSEIFYFSAIEKNAALKKKLNDHLEDVLHRGFTSLEDLIARQKTLRQEIATYDAKLVAAGNDDAKIKALASEGDQLREKIKRVTAAEQHLTRIAQFEHVVVNIRSDAPKLITMSVLVMLSFGAFAWAVGKPKSDSEAASPASSSAIEFNAGKGWANIAKLLSDRCGDADPVKAIVRGHPMTDWIEIQIASSAKCAGARFTLPATIIDTSAKSASVPAPAPTPAPPVKSSP